MSRKSTPLAPPRSVAAAIGQIRRGRDPIETLTQFAVHLNGREADAWNRREDWLTRQTPTAERNAAIAFGHIEALAEIIGTDASVR